MIDSISKNVKLSSKKKKLHANELDNQHVPSQRNKDQKKESVELPHTVSEKKKRKRSLSIDTDSTLGHAYDNSELPSSTKKKSKNKTSKELVETVDATGDKSKKPQSKDKKGKVKQKKKAKSTEEEKPDVKELSLEYLRSWKKNRSNWKFQKVRQTWLLRHMYEDEMVPADDFIIMLSYLEGLKGSSAREETQTKAKEVMENDSEKDEDSESYNRARNVLQIVS